MRAGLAKGRLARWLPILRCAGLGVALLLVGLAAGAQTIDEFPIPNHSGNFPTSNPFGVAPGPDGNVWFTETLASSGVPLNVGRITPQGVITEYALSPLQGSLTIAKGPDGAMWFVHPAAKITTAGVITSYSVVAGGQFIATGPDGKLWITENNKIARVDPSGGTLMAEYPVPSHVSTLGAVAAGPDGNVWFTESDYGNAARVARVDLSKLVGCDTNASLCITEWPVPGETGGFGLTGITAGPDGNVWFTSTGMVNRITPSGTITQFAAASATTQGGITSGPDGALWYAGMGTIGRMTTSGALTEIPAPADFTSPRQICAGPDGNIWFAEISANKIGRVNLSGGGPGPTPTPTAPGPTPTPTPPGAPLRGHVTPLAVRTPIALGPPPP
jgi:virginiamycin B lyase